MPDGATRADCHPSSGVSIPSAGARAPIVLPPIPKAKEEEEEKECEVKLCGQHGCILESYHKGLCQMLITSVRRRSAPAKYADESFDALPTSSTFVLPSSSSRTPRAPTPIAATTDAPDGGRVARRRGSPTNSIAGEAAPQMAEKGAVLPPVSRAPSRAPSRPSTGAPSRASSRRRRGRRHARVQNRKAWRSARACA